MNTASMNTASVNTVSMNTDCITLAKVSKGFDGVPVLRDISAAVQPGEVIGLLGLNGAGKTTLLETLLGFCIADSGSIKLFGGNLDAAAKSRIGFVPQRDELVDTMTGQLYLNMIAGFYPGWNPALIKRLTQEWAVPLDKKILKLSVGQRQKLSIIAALGHEPDLLVLDEPVASLDPLARRQFLRELIDISATHQRSILFSTHIVSDLERIASRLWLIKDGHLAIDTPLDEIKEHYVRVHLTPGVAVPRSLPGLLRQRTEEHGSVLVFSAWSETALGFLTAVSPQAPAVEPLSLEEIFLELHA